MRKITLSLFVQLLMVSLVFAQVRTVTGKVTALDGRPLDGATVKIEGSKAAATATNTNGEFKISAKSGDVLIVSSVNSKPERIKVTSQSVYNVTLTPFVSALDEVIVTAGGLTTKKKEQGYNATQVTADEIVAAKPTSLGSALAGKVAGLQVSATGGGINSDYRLILRGQRSLLGNNQALIVLDNAIVPSTILGNLNPGDIADITVLNGAGAVALYGSDASNGALIVTTKRGRKGFNQINISNTTTLETVAFNPKEQSGFGGGGNGYGVDPLGNPIYSPIENQSYGPAFDGSIRPIGAHLADGSQQTTPYSWKDHNKFWNTGSTNQTDFSINTGDDVSTLFFSAQYVNVNGTTPHDAYNRTAFRLNGSRKVSKTFSANYGAYYVQNRYDITTAGATMYNNMLNMPGNIPVTTFANWQTDKYSNPNGYYNPWYLNPYFTLDNYRQKTRNDYFMGNLELKWAPLSWLDFTMRSNITTQNSSYKNTVGVFTYTAYAISASSGSKSNITGSVSDDNDYNTQLTADFLVGLHKKVSDFSFNLNAGVGTRQNMSKGTVASIAGLVNPGLYNLSNTLNAPTASSSDVTTRKLGAYGDFKVAYKNYLFLHVTGRNDWVSVLAPANWSFFYPAADLSFSATDAIKALKNIRVIDYLKIRGGVSKVGNVNIGAYSLLPTFGQANGYPYNGVAGYTVGNTIVSSNLQPEFTKGGEAGFDFSLLKNLVEGGFTWYKTNTTNQTVPVSISWATGASNYLFNTGETSNTGIETKLKFTAYRKKDLSIRIGGTYTHNDNKVVSINSSLPQLAIATYSSGTGSYAVPGLSFPVLMGTDYSRDPLGRVIVNATTGLPLVDQTLKVLGNANAKDMIGLDLTVTWKHFHFYTLFEYRGGGQVYNAMGPDLDWSGMGIRTVAYGRKRFVFPNSSYADPSNPGSYIANKTVAVQNGNGNDGFWTDQTENMGVSSNYITSNAFWKLRQLMISYEVPSSVISKVKFLKAATISVQGRNLFVWLPKSNVYTDPEYSDAGSGSNGIGLTNLQSPPSRYYGATISLTF